jgi:fructokinase
MIYAGVELGGTKCVAVLARDADDVIARAVIPTTSPDETIGSIERTLVDWQRSHDFAALGIASFGPLDLALDSPAYGHILETPKPGWQGAIVAPRLRDALGLPVVFDTDVNGAAHAEMRWGSGRGMVDCAYVTIGTGVGVGLIVNGRPTRGFGHCELGHIRVKRWPRDDFPGACPYHGDCVEGLASGTALKARFGDQLNDLAADDRAWDCVAWTLAQLCHAIVCAAAPQRIAMGGGVIDQQPHLLPRINALLVESLNGFLHLPGDKAYVRAPELGKDAGPLGAIALAMSATA